MIVTWSTIRSFNELCFTTRVTSDVTCEKVLGSFFPSMSMELSILYQWDWIENSFLNPCRSKKRENMMCLPFTLPPFHISHLISQSLPFMSNTNSPSFFSTLQKVQSRKMNVRFTILVYGGREKEISIVKKRKNRINLLLHFPFHPSLYITAQSPSFETLYKQGYIKANVQKTCISVLSV